MNRLIILILLLIVVEGLIVFQQASFPHTSSSSLERILHKSSFVDVIDKVGIEKLPNSAGVSWSDFDNDGYLDLFMAGNETRLYRNNGNGTFAEVEAARKTFVSNSMAGFFGDYDNDGCKDLFVVISGRFGSDSLYHNNCDRSFTNVTTAAGIGTEFYRGYGAAWADYDNDGFLDLYVANYGLPEGRKERITEPNALYHNNGDGTFTEVARRVGVSGKTNCGSFAKKFTANAPAGWPFKESFQPIWFDYNNDGNIDLFIATDAGVSPLYRNNGNGTFAEVTKEAGLCRGGTGMGASVGDYNNDEYMDIYVTNVGANFLWHNNGDGTFSEMAANALVAEPLKIGWGTGFFDYDNDGDLDLYVVNGTVWTRGGILDPEVGTVMIDKLYKNNGDGTFLEVSANEGIYGDYSKDTGAFGDFNNDGFVDVYIGTSYFTSNTQSHLYKNRGNTNNWITIALQGVKSNRDAIGARILLRTGGETQIREVSAGSSFIAQNSLWQTFGLGQATIVDEIEIRWPSGIKTQLRDIKVNQKISVTEE